MYSPSDFTRGRVLFFFPLKVVFHKKVLQNSLRDHEAPPAPVDLGWGDDVEIGFCEVLSIHTYREGGVDLWGSLFFTLQGSFPGEGSSKFPLRPLNHSTPHKSTRGGGFNGLRRNPGDPYCEKQPWMAKNSSPVTDFPPSRIVKGEVDDVRVADIFNRIFPM